MTSLRELRERRSAAWTQAQEYRLREKEGKLTNAEAVAWERTLDEVDSLTNQIRSTPGGENDAFSSGTVGAAGRGIPGYSDGTGYVADVRDTGPAADAFRDYLRSGDDVELRAQGVSTGAGGGYTVPEGFRAKIVSTMKAFGGIRRLAEVVTTDAGNDLPYPTEDDTANAGSIVAENTQVTEQDIAFGGKTLGAYMYTSKMVRVSMQLLQDSGFPLESWLPARTGRRIGRAQAPHFITGTGASQPQGLLTGTTVGVNGAASPTYDNLVDLVHSVDAAYREGGEMGAGGLISPDGVEGIAWLMNDQTLGVLRKLKDTQNRPLIEPDIKAGMPNTILGFRVVIDNAMPAIASGATPIAFGNVRAAYVIRDVRAIDVLRLVERYADFLQHGFLAFQRADGMVQDASAVKKLQTA